MKVLAFVGETGTGKSTLAAHLGARGAVVIDGDTLGHRLLEEDKAIREAVAREFGRGLFDASGRVDRKKLGALVFNDSGALRRLNAILHPAITGLVSRKIDRARRAGADLVVFDAALILEVELPFTIDLVVALRCGREEQVRRLRALGVEDAAITARLASQRHLEKSFHKADHIVDTGREIGAVTAEIDALVAGLLAEPDEG